MVTNIYIFNFKRACLRVVVNTHLVQVSDTLVSSSVSELAEKERETFGTLLGKQGDHMASSPSQK